MTSRLVEWEGKPFALLVETDEGDYLVPPIVRDSEGNMVEGVEILMAIVEAGVSVRLPVVHGTKPADLAEIDRRMVLICEMLGVPTLEQWVKRQE